MNKKGKKSDKKFKKNEQKVDIKGIKINKWTKNGQDKIVTGQKLEKKDKDVAKNL